MLFMFVGRHVSLKEEELIKDQGRFKFVDSFF